jgi:hypothetical protein
VEEKVRSVHFGAEVRYIEQSAELDSVLDSEFPSQGLEAGLQRTFPGDDEPCGGIIAMENAGHGG